MTGVENIEETGTNPQPIQQNAYSVVSRKSRRRRDHKPPKYLTSEEIARFFKVIDDLRDRAIFRVIYHRGLRAHEAGRLRLSDFQPREGKLRVTRGKGSAGGEYRLVEEEVKALRAYIRHRRGDEPGPLFLTRQGYAVDRIQIWRLMRRYCNAAGIDPEKAHPHALKHSCDTHLAELGEDLLDIQDHLGHRNIANTRLYVEVTNKRRDARAERLRNWR